MKFRHASPWSGLYLLALLIGALLYADARVHLGPTVHTVFLLAIILSAVSLAWRWSESHPDLAGSQGGAAQAETHALAGKGLEPGSVAPSPAARQAQYRQMMFEGLTQMTDLHQPPSAWIE
jgi:hypothetical protein